MSNIFVQICVIPVFEDIYFRYYEYIQTISNCKKNKKFQARCLKGSFVCKIYKTV